MHHIEKGNRKQREEALATIKLLGNDLGITIVGCGTIAALRTLRWDPQIERRFEPHRLEVGVITNRPMACSTAWRPVCRFATLPGFPMTRSRPGLSTSRRGPRARSPIWCAAPP
ncbi:TniB family NTP-binding protein [Halopseudomonas pachastrellae]|nr:TniB family NTP-binding protein [Halopseudomonas pachastrellae]